MIASAERSTHMEFNYLQRVKVYQLNDEGKWDDRGTGHVSVEYLGRSDAVGLVIIDEEDNQTLLVHRISAGDIYRRQEDTIISWTDPEVATDLALSFQETMGSTFIWNQICSVQRSIHFPSVAGLDSGDRPVCDDLEHSGTSRDDGGGSEALELPPIELFNLPQIAKAIGEVPPFDKDRVASIVVRNQNYIRKLVKLFHTCEDLANGEGLQSMFRIVKGLISLNDGHIFDIIFSDEYIMDIIGALEYDPGLPTRQNHRAHLLEHVSFKEVVPIRDPAILSKIHQTHLIGYVKDVILPRALDDQTFATMNSIILHNNVSVVSSLQNDSAFLSELFSRLRSLETSKKNRRDLVFFVQELCNLNKHPQPLVRSQLFSALVKEGLFDIMKDILIDTDEMVRLSGCDILIVIMNNDPTLLRGFLVHQTAHTLFSELVSGMVTQSEDGRQAQLLEIIRMLLDSETIDAAQVERSPFLEVFYEDYMDQIVEVLIRGCPPEVGVESSKDVNDQYRIERSVSPEILKSICDLLCFCVQHHRFRIKYYVMRKHVVEKVLRLTRRKEKYLVLAAIRFLKTCIFLKEEFYHQYIVKNNCFQPIISAFVANGTRYNLLNSAVLELIERIRKDDIKSLIVHLIETYSSELGTIDYVNTFQALKLKYDQMMKSSSGFQGGTVVSGGRDDGYYRNNETVGQVGLSDSRKRKDEHNLDEDEEDRFNKDSDDEGDKKTSQSRAFSYSKSLSDGPLNKSILPDQNSPSNAEDTTTAKLRTAGGEQPTKAVILVSKNHVPFRGNKFGLVDYEDEEDEMPMYLGSKRRDGGGELARESDRLFVSVPVTDSTWSKLEDATVAKRKSHSGPDSDRNDAICFKRQRPEMIQESGHSNESSSVTFIDDIDKLALSVTDAETRGIEESTKYFQISAFPENPVSKSDSVKVFSFEESRHSCQKMLALLPGNALIADRKTFDSVLQSNTRTHVDGGDSGSIVNTNTGGSIVISNGKVSTFSNSANCILTMGKDKQNVMNGEANSTIEQSSSLKEGVSISPRRHEKSSLHNYSSSLSRVVDEYGGESRVKPEEVVRNLTAEKHTNEDCRGDSLGQNCNGTVTEGVERVNHRTAFMKDSIAVNGHTQQLNDGSLGSEKLKLTSLGNDRKRTVPPTSRGPFTVR